MQLRKDWGKEGEGERRRRDKRKKERREKINAGRGKQWIGGPEEGDEKDE